MGAAAWGDLDRLTNSYYKSLREIFHFCPSGRVYINRFMANWHRFGEASPYQDALKKVLGEPIPPKSMWNPGNMIIMG
jgi:carbamoyltransferase